MQYICLTDGAVAVAVAGSMLLSDDVDSAVARNDGADNSPPTAAADIMTAS